MKGTASIIILAAALALSPLLRSVINRTKARIAGRVGPPMLQPYYNLAKLLKKGSVYSCTTSWIFRAAPVAILTTMIGALFFVPLGGEYSVVHFQGDLLLFAYCLGVGRFFMIIAALDTGSSFEGMGASREAFYSALAEPALLLGIGGLGVVTRTLSISEIYSGLNGAFVAQQIPALTFIFFALLIVYLTENSRIPVDDPTTHLELTMIHEVMILDHSGVDLALIEYAGSLKLWILGALITGLMLPIHTEFAWLNIIISVAALFLLAVIVGVIESTMARFKLVRIPQLLANALVLAALWVIWVAR